MLSYIVVVYMARDIKRYTKSENLEESMKDLKGLSAILLETKGVDTTITILINVIEDLTKTLNEQIEKVAVLEEEQEGLISIIELQETLLYSDWEDAPEPTEFEDYEDYMGRCGM